MFNIGQQHYYYDVFKKLGVTNISIARRLHNHGIEKAVSTVAQYLNGYRAVPEDVEKVFQEIVDELNSKKIN